MMEPDLLVCTPSYVEWLNEVGNENSTSDFNSIAELMDGVGSSVDETVLPEMMLSVENTTGSSDTVQVEVEVHPIPPQPIVTGDVEKEVVGDGEKHEEDGVEIAEEVHGPPNWM